MATGPVAALDEFWDDFVLAGCPGFPPRIDAWKSVAEMTDNVDVVVVGTPYAVDHRWDAQYGERVSVVVVAVDQVLHGHVKSRRNGDIEVVTYAPAEPDPETVAGISHVLFLKNLGDDERAVGRPVSEDDRYSYFMESPFENLYANVDGKVVVPDFDRVGFLWEADWYPLPPKLRDTSFEALIKEVLDAPDSTQLQNGPETGMVTAC